MRKFLIYITLFILPIVMILIGLEQAVQTIPNSYSYKYNYIKHHGDKLQAVAIGHSQLYDGFMPEVFSVPSFNLCNSDQNYADDYYLLKELLPNMPNLKIVILPIGYMNVGDVKFGNELTERSCYYHEYMGLDYEGHLPLGYRYECFMPYKAMIKVFSYYCFHDDIVGCDSLGRRTEHYLRHRKNKVGDERIIRGYTCSEHVAKKLYIKYENYLKRILNYLNARDITVVMVSPPYYWNSERQRVNKEQVLFLDKYMAGLSVDYPIKYLDLENDTTYSYDDFFDETHLSEKGAEKFTKAIDEFIFSGG